MNELNITQEFSAVTDNVRAMSAPALGSAFAGANSGTPDAPIVGLDSNITLGL